MNFLQTMDKKKLKNIKLVAGMFLVQSHLQERFAFYSQY